MPLGYFPSPLADETIYSICARFHRACGVSAAATSNFLNMPGAHAHPAVPVALDFISIASNGIILANEETLRQRTMLRSFLPLMPYGKRNALLVTCRESGNTVNASARAGMNRYTHSRRLLRFCRECAAVDCASEGLAYWHATEQCPGTWLCRTHGTVLSYVRQISRRREWVLPLDSDEITERPKLDVDAQLKLLRLQEVINWIGAQRSIEPGFLQVMLRMRVRTAGLSRSELKWSKSERVHISLLANAHYCGVEVPDLEEALRTEDWFGMLFRDRRHYDPLTWALALSWVGSTAHEKLNDEYIDAQARKPQPDMFEVTSNERRRTHAPSTVYLAFQDADSKGDAMNRGVISESELDGWLRRDPDLKPYWEASRRRRRHAKCVSEICAFLSEAPSSLRVDVLKNCMAAYRWLEVNDPHRLASLLPAPVLKARQQSLFF